MAKYSVKLSAKDIYLTGNEAGLWSDDPAAAQVFSTKKEATAMLETVVGMTAEVVAAPSVPAPAEVAEEAPAEEG